MGGATVSATAAGRMATSRTDADTPEALFLRWSGEHLKVGARPPHPKPVGYH